MLPLENDLESDVKPSDVSLPSASIRFVTTETLRNWLWDLVVSDQVSRNLVAALVPSLRDEYVLLRWDDILTLFRDGGSCPVCWSEVKGTKEPDRVYEGGLDDAGAGDTLEPGVP